VTLDDVVEASGRVASSGVEAWLSESNARVPLDKRALVQLSDNHVAGSVIDLMVALAYPQKFEVRRASPGGGGAGFFPGDITDFYPGVWSDLAGYGLGYGVYGVPYFFGGSSYFQPYSYFLPVTSGSTDISDERASHGQVINGRGYTRVQPREAYRGTATASGGTTQRDSGSSGGGSTDGGSSGGSSGGGSSTASPGGYSGGGGSSTGLTAVPR
jgi:hypothetical protein